VNHPASEDVRLRVLVEQMPAVLWSTDRDLRFTSSLGGGLAALGLAPGQVVGMTLYEFFGTGDSEFLPIAAHRRALAGESVRYEIEWGGRAYQSYVEPLRDPAGEIAGTTGVAFDVTDRKRLEQALRQSEERFSKAFHASPVPLAIGTLDEGRLLEVNDAFLQLSGSLREEVVGRTTTELGFWVDLDRRPLVERLRQQGLIREVSARLRARTGEIREVTASAAVVELAGVACALTVLLDVTERRRAERALEESRTLLQKIIDTEPECVKLVDSSGALVQMNRAGLEMIEVESIAAVAGRPVLDLITPEHRQRFSAFLARVLRGESATEEFEIVGLRGTRRWMESHAAPLRDASDRVTAMLAVTRDVTERKRVQAALGEAEERLRQAQKMEAVGRLAGGIAHDFNNILNVIVGHTELLLQAQPVADRVRNHGEQIRRAADRAIDLTSQLLAFSRKQVLQPRVLDLNAVVRETEGLLHRLIAEHIQLAVVTAEDLGRVRADRGQIQQVVINLAVNARDAMPEGGRLLIETANVELDEGYARLHVGQVRAGPYVLLAVSDSGCGMDAETRARIFEPFFTTKELGKGTGLGLATVYGIVKQSDGFIWVYSEPGQGTTFKVYLPRVDEPARPAPAEPSEVARARAEETVLLVEDDDALRALSQEMLESLGYRVMVAASGDAALAGLEARREPVDLILTDVVMPRMGGRHLAERARALHPESRVLFMSGYTDDAVLRFGLLEEGQDFLQKPFTVARLAGKIRELLDRPRGDRRAVP
jgi:PAS domain S-box-containing protein